MTAKTIAIVRPRRARMLLRAMRLVEPAMSVSQVLHALEDLVRGRIDQFAVELPVGDEHHAVGVRGGVRIVGDHDDGLAELADRARA